MGGIPSLVSGKSLQECSLIAFFLITILIAILIAISVNRWDTLVENILEVTDRNPLNLWKNVSVGAGEVRKKVKEEGSQ